MSEVGFVAEDWDAGANLADNYLSIFVERISHGDSVQIFLLGHALELYVKTLYWKINGAPYPKNTHKIIDVLKKLNLDCLNKYMDEYVDKADKYSAMDLIFNGHLADLKYLNMKHNNLPQLSTHFLTPQNALIFFKFLSLIFQLLEKTKINSPHLQRVLNNIDEKLKNENVLIVEMQIAGLLKMALDVNYNPQKIQTWAGEINY